MLKNGSPGPSRPAKSTAVKPIRSSQSVTCASPASQELIEIVRARDREITENRMNLPVAAGDGEASSSVAAVRRADEIGRKERRVGGRRNDPLPAGPLTARIDQSGEDAGERAREAADEVGHDRHVEDGEACRITVGVEGQRADLRPQAIDDAGEQRPPAEGEERLVATAQAGRPAARENDAEDRTRCHHHRTIAKAAAGRCFKFQTEARPAAFGRDHGQCRRI